MPVDTYSYAVSVSSMTIKC